MLISATPATPKKLSGDGIGGDAPLAQVDLDAAFVGHEAAEGEVHRADAALVAAVALAFADRVHQDGVVGDAAFAVHHAGGQRAAVEEDALVVFVVVIVVPVQQPDRLVGGQVQGFHRHGVAQVHFAGRGQAQVVERAHGHAGRDAHLGLDFGPTADGQRVQAGFGDQAVEGDAEADDIFKRPLGDALPGSVPRAAAPLFRRRALPAAGRISCGGRYRRGQRSRP